VIPIKGYATFDPLKHCWIGSGFKTEWFSDLDIYKNDKIMDPLKRIADETEEDYQRLEQILRDAGVKTYRSFLDIDKVKSIRNVCRPPVQPRDHFGVIGEKIYVQGVGAAGYYDVLKQIHRNDMIITSGAIISTAAIIRVGKDLYWDITEEIPNKVIEEYKQKWVGEGFRVHVSYRGYHSDAVFTVVKPGCIVSLHDIQDYKKEFPGWDVCYVSDRSWSAISSFEKMREKVSGKWWVKGEEHNDQLIEFVNTWLEDWVGYVEETVFDVNMLSIDQDTIICNNYNKKVFEHFKKHKVEPVIFNFRHKYFWDGGVNCITQDLYREGKQEDYFG
jgi:hypothetical protein